MVFLCCVPLCKKMDSSASEIYLCTNFLIKPSNQTHTRNGVAWFHEILSQLNQRVCVHCILLRLIFVKNRLILIPLEKDEELKVTYYIESWKKELILLFLPMLRRIPVNIVTTVTISSDLSFYALHYGKKFFFQNWIRWWNLQGKLNIFLTY